MQLKTLHGQFSFRLQKYQGAQGAGDYFALTNQLKEGHISPRLQELSAYYSNRLSYEEVAALVERFAGKKLLCDQTAWRHIATKAQQLSQQIEKEVTAELLKAEPTGVSINPKIDLYEPNEKEIILFQDAIQVKGQKDKRETIRSTSLRKRKKPEPTLKKLAVITDIALLQKKTGGFEYLAAPIAQSGEELFPLARVIKAQVIQEYGAASEPLKLVAITDGATLIRRQLHSAFGKELVMALDWYHLCKKLRSLMSMVAHNKEEKKTHLKQMVPLLWHGKTDEVIVYLKCKVTPRRKDKWWELIRYLKKHCREIVNYGRRSQVGKTIGSGRMEKGVDLSVGRRQKKKGISWSPRGSRALSLLKVAELNGKWHELWFPAQSV